MVKVIYSPKHKINETYEQQKILHFKLGIIEVFWGVRQFTAAEQDYFSNVVSVLYSVVMEKVQVYIGDVSQQRGVQSGAVY
jgi:hypothetical protein